MVKKVLIITYFFPPRPAVASIRLGGLAKYLPEFGWEPTILTAKLPSPADARYQVIETPDSDLLLEWKRRLGFSTDKTFREQMGQTGKNDTVVDSLLNIAKEIVAYPDYQKHWYSDALPVARDLLNTEHYDAIISSAGPAATHMIAHNLKREFNILWIADFRDLWTQHQNYSFSRIRKFFETNLEVKTLSDANAITTVSQPLADKLHQIHHTPVSVISNGFDPELLNHTASLTSKFSINYTGRVYRGKMDPEPLFKVIRKLIDEHKMDPSDMEIHFWGCNETWLQGMIDKYDLNPVITLHDAVPHEQALEIQRRSQILLLFTWNDPREEGIVTGKIFEYLAARRPVLAIGRSGGTIQEILDETSAGCIAGNEQEIVTAVLGYYDQYRMMQRVLYSGNDSSIRNYSHQHMACRFATILDSITKSQSVKEH